MNMQTNSTQWRSALIGLTVVTGVCLSLFTVVGHGQNTASGQRFAEPPVPAASRDAAANLATKILAPFTVASYLVEGRPSRTYSATKALMYGEPAVWASLVDRLADKAVRDKRPKR